MSYRRKKKVYYKIDLDDMQQDWLDNSKCDNIRTCVKSKPTGGTRFVILTFDKGSVPMSLYSTRRQEEMKKGEALAELAGSIWQT
jgi:hypothetical protein